MVELIALLGALFLVVCVQMLRAVLGMPFARVQASLVPPTPPAPLAPLFEAAFGELSGLGFGDARGLLMSRVDGAATSLPLRIVLRRPDGTIVALAPPQNSARPHQLYVVFATRLVDGRWAVSHVFDPYYALVQDGRLVARTGAEATLALQAAAHDRWLSTLGSAPVPADDAAVLAFGDEEAERLRQSLIARGALVPSTPDLATPSWGFGLRMLQVSLSAPKPPLVAGTVSPERVSLFARQVELVRDRSPRRSAQLLLFAASVVAFMAVGAMFWGMTVAWSILVVIVIHEFGHFLAMRAFGYRNVHMLALPLVGGVAMGHDHDPAATRSAWTSLMGPLPGILIGWALLVVIVFGLAPAWAQGWILPLTVMFLIINYLNVLPVPPLDGAHVVEALLPARMRVLQLAFVGVAAAVGAFVAWQFGFILLTIIAALQLLGLPARWRLVKAERELAGVASWSAESRPARMLRALRAIERQLGPAVNVLQRVNQANAIVHRLDMKPMGHIARAATSLVYAALLAVPVYALVEFESIWTQQASSPVAAEAPDEYMRKAAEWREKARAQPLAVLVAPDDGTPPASGASDAAFASAETRLGRALPKELREIYSTSDGVPALGLSPLSEVRPLGNALQEAWSPYEITLMLESGDEFVDVPLADTHGWWLLGTIESDQWLLYLPDGHAKLPGMRFVDAFLESPSAYPTLRDYLEAMWASGGQTRELIAQQAQRTEATRKALRDASVETLIANWQPASLTQRLITREAAWADAAEAPAIAAAEARLGVALPADYRELLALHDGFAPLGLLPVAEIARWPADRLSSVSFGAKAGAESSGDAPTMPPEADFSSCVVAAGRADGESMWMRLLWCPPGTKHAGWYDTLQPRRYDTFREWLVEQAAQQVGRGG